MTESQSLFEAILHKFESRHDGVAEGKMMSAPALKYKGKVFAFYHDNQMGFKLGKEFDPSEADISEWSWLSPFKNKPPMKAWFMIPFSESDKWEELTMRALNFMKG